jgi:hypothetical protein
VFSMPRVTLFKRRGLVLVPIIAAFVIAAPVAARQPVAQQLTPQPPDFYACTATGGGTICRATTSDPYELEPTGIWCGTGAGAFEVLDSGGHIVRATRWYDTNGNLTRRERVNDFPGAHLSNPLNGASIYYQQHNTDWDVLAVPGDLSSSTWSGHGVLSMTVPGYGRVILEAGVIKVAPGDNVEHQAGPTDLGDYFSGNASVIDDLCAALAAG